MYVAVYKKSIFKKKKKVQFIELVFKMIVTELNGVCSFRSS